ncbi:hypothetical protein ASD79_16345 [Caulobacter sp. Root655]|uniref:hypothetical protein n=1 Tax=Caulobacter sp. Root655 TaxID=1736578 RepID=UPI0006F60D5C|nr:hypothetical protein [Caulobacter sp. Root655]KRA56638.1 hypothetical protein ASD79_16345 [Caulobacter sp. Root655]
MPLQNRVTPFGDIVAIPQRGLFTGNRGIIHDPATKTLLDKRWASRAWLVCACQYKDFHRQVMARRSWTELFFLDEATALAAGHRPCFYCRRDAAEAFRAAWMRAKGVARPTAPQIDEVLHGERLVGRRKRLHAIDVAVRDLPDGAMIAVDGTAYAVVAGVAHAWTETGYGPSVDIDRARALLTPPSTLATLRAGYRPALHPALTA